uniref:sensor histidine kinase n=1 Tax=Vreelandella massiliensis TaxID=1816686 RepID=UPI0011819180
HDTLWVKGDLVRLEQVIVNLISNALQAMKETPAPTLTITVTADAHHVAIHVADNGPGIDEAHLGQIFEPFFTTKAPGSGLGLGLSISSRIMEDLGGKLHARNRPQGGAEFNVTLPLAAAPSTVLEKPPHA